MDYAEILAQTKQLLGEVSEGSSTYAATDFSAAIQWAQEQTSQHLGLTYIEVVRPVLVGIGPWGDSVNAVTIPTDAIKVTRAEISDTAPPGGYSLTIEPAEETIRFDEGGNQVGIIMFDVSINRFGGYSGLIDVSSSAFEATDNFNGVVGGTGFSDLVGNTLTSAPDNFTISFSTTSIGWGEVSTNWDNAILHGAGSDSVSADSNTFRVTPIGASPYLLVSVDPGSLNFSPHSPPNENVFVATITRMNGFSGPISAFLPGVTPTHNSVGTGPDYDIQFQLDTTNGVVGVPGITEDNAPDTFNITVTVGSNSIGPITYSSMNLFVYGEDGIWYGSNTFELTGGG